MKIIYSFLALTVAFSVSCGRHEWENDSKILIKGGTAVTSPNLIYRTTVGITKQDFFEKGYTFCTGTIIGKRTILTAAHCLTKDTDGPRIPTVDLKVVFGTQSVQEWKVGKVKVQAWHKNFLPSAATNRDATEKPNDVGLLQLVEDIPEGFEAIAVDWDSNLSTDEKVILAGNGTSTGTDKPGTLRFVNQAISSLDKDRGRIETGSRGEDNERGACGGDSGGPLFVKVDGGWKVRGILSIGSSNILTGYCLGWNAYTDAALYRTRIEGGIESLADTEQNVYTF